MCVEAAHRIAAATLCMRSMPADIALSDSDDSSPALIEISSEEETDVECPDYMELERSISLVSLYFLGVPLVLIHLLHAMNTSSQVLHPSQACLACAIWCSIAAVLDGVCACVPGIACVHEIRECRSILTCWRCSAVFKASRMGAGNTVFLRLASTVHTSHTIIKMEFQSSQAINSLQWI